LLAGAKGAGDLVTEIFDIDRCLHVLLPANTLCYPLR